MRVGIVGAGINGLWIAWQLAKRGNEVTVFEARSTIGKPVCSGLVSERIWHFVPRKAGLVKNIIHGAKVHFPNKTVRLNFRPTMLVLEHAELDRYVAELASRVGARILLGHSFTRLFYQAGKRPQIAVTATQAADSVPPKHSHVYEFDRVIGCDGALSVVRHGLGLPEPGFRLGIITYVNRKSRADTVDVWPHGHGFSWIIPRGNKIEYGTIEKSDVAKRQFGHFCAVNRIKPKEVLSATIPHGLVPAAKGQVALAGDAIGLTKSWSIDGDEAVVVKDGEFIKNVRIKELVDKYDIEPYHSVKALSPTKNPGSIDYCKVASFIEHPINEPLYEIVLEKGYKVTTTASHSVIVADGWELRSKAVNELKPKGDCLLLATNIPQGKFISELNIIDWIVKETPSFIPRIRVKGGRHLLWSRQRDAPVPSMWKYDTVPLQFFVNSAITPKGVKISYNQSGGLWIPDTIPVTAELCRLLGYYVAEGDSAGMARLHLSFGKADAETGIIEDFKHCFKTVFGLVTANEAAKANPSTGQLTEFPVTAGGKLLAWLFSNVLGIGSGASRKQFPWIVFNIPDNLKIEFLKAYIRGDGYVRIRMPARRRNWSAEVSVATISRKLVSDTILLSLQLGLLPSIEEGRAREHSCYGKRVKSSKVYKITWSRRQDVIRFADMFDRAKLHQYLAAAATSRSTTLFPKRLFPKEFAISIRNKNLRKTIFNRLNSKQCTGLDRELIEQALKELDPQDSRVVFLGHLITSGLLPLRIKQIRRVKSNGPVYDLGVVDTNMFSGGVGPIVLHNSWGGIIWGLTASGLLIRNFPNFASYNRTLERYFGPRILFSDIATAAAVWAGFHTPGLLPRQITIDSDWALE